MKLSSEQLSPIPRRRFLILPALFSRAEISGVLDELDPLFGEDHSANIRESVSGEVRTAMALHLRSVVCDKLTRHPRLVEPAVQILETDSLYIQQVKVNAKVAFSGEVWQWHYDFATHHNEDGVPEALALNLHVFLDDVSEFNGPLWFIRGSHRHGPVPAALDTVTTSYPLWCVGPEAVAELVSNGGLVSATGPAGTALIFGDSLVHGSPPNMSPWNRRIFSSILNPVANAYTKEQRPEHQHHRDLSPLETLPDDCLVRA